MVGPGAIATRVVPDIALLPDARLVAVSSRSARRARQFAADHGFQRSYWDGAPGTENLTGVRALAQDPEVEVVYVASPHGYHHQHVAELLLAGKHVLCEKALAVSAAEVRDLVDLAQQHGCLLMEAVWTAMTPGFRRVMHIVNSGRLGTVLSVTGAIGFNATPDPQHRLFSPADGGGVTLDMVVYPLLYSDAIQAEVLQRCVVGHIGPTGVDDDLALQLERTGGCAHISATLRRVPATGVTLSATQGWLRVEGRLNNPASLEWMTDQRHSNGLGPVIETITTVGAGYVPQIREATRCIRAGLLESPFVPWEDSLTRAQLFDAIRADLGLTTH